MNDILELVSLAPSFFGYFVAGLVFFGAYFMAYTPTSPRATRSS